MTDHPRAHPLPSFDPQSGQAIDLAEALTRVRDPHTAGAAPGDDRDGTGSGSTD